MRAIIRCPLTFSATGQARKPSFSCLLQKFCFQAEFRLFLGQKPGIEFKGKLLCRDTGFLTDVARQRRPAGLIHFRGGHPMLIGYARVSTDDQHLDLQRDALAQAGCPKLYEDRESGAKAARPGLTMALEVLREGDTLVVWRLDRLGRSLKDLIALVETLDAKSIGLKSLKESIDTTSSGGKLVFH